MRIAYFGQMADVSVEHGISKKIHAQAMHWMRAGHEVRYFSLVPTISLWAGFAPVQADLLPRGTVAQRFARSYRLACHIRDWQPDVIYFRYAHHSPGLSSLFRRVPTIAEINSDDLTEYPITLSRAKVMYHRLTRRRVLGAMAGFVAVTRELAVRFANFGRPTDVLANGIDLEAFPLTPPASVNAPMRLIFVGSAGTPWHGLDRVAELARLLPNAAIDMVGCTAENWNEPEAPPKTLHFHGTLTRAAYTPLLARATAAIGTMALFRKKMDEACPLKVREYLACGLPVIGAYQDTDIPPEADYFLRLPNNETPVALLRGKIAAWLEHWRGQRVPRSAVLHLDNGIKETRRLQILAQFASRQGASP